MYQRSWNPEEGEILHSYVHNPARTNGIISLGKIGALVFLKAQDKAHNKQLQELASSLSLHVAAMKPVYLFENELPNEIREQVINEQTTPEAKKKALEKLLAREVMMEQELATSEEPLKIKDLLK